MDTNDARRVLRLDRSAPLTAEAVEAAYSHEAWQRHPSRYPEGEARVAAEAWAGTLAEARAVLLDAVLRAEATAAPQATAGQPGPWGPAGTVPSPAQAGPWAPASPALAGSQPPASPRRRTGLVIGIVAASLGAIALVAALAFGALAFLGFLSDGGDSTAPPGTATPPSDGAAAGSVTRYESGETLYTFPAALEQYSDGRYGDLCPTNYADGCWEWALFTVDDCGTLQVDFAYSNDPDPTAPAEARETTTYTNVAADTAQPVVFGNDDYDIAWINDVTCLD